MAADKSEGARRCRPRLQSTSFFYKFSSIETRGARQRAEKYPWNLNRLVPAEGRLVKIARE